MAVSSNLMETLTIPSPVTSISREEGEFVCDWIKRHKLKHTIEIGFAYGVSTAFIMSAHEATHIAIDPYQMHFEQVGLKNIDALGLRSRLDFRAGFSHEVLPELLKEKKKFDFAFVDGGHLFDEIMIDFYYLEKMMVDGGFILFDDFWMPSTQKVAAFIEKNRADFFRVEKIPGKFIMFCKRGKEDRAWYHYEDF